MMASDSLGAGPSARTSADPQNEPATIIPMAKRDSRFVKVRGILLRI